jgi:hypothetical protein
MGESQHQSATTSSRFGIRSGGGEIVEVQGGHIVRSTGRKDRHSKVCTAKGPRDRRVRLSAHTAIQFYDVQDRLGYDRPSKAVDWLIKKAKTAIDELEELPAWKPTNNFSISHHQQTQMLDENQNQDQDQNQNPIGIHCNAADTIGSNMHNLHQQMGENPNNNTNTNNTSSSSSSFLPPSLDSDSIADTIKSFFPTASAETTTHSPPSQMQFQHYNPPPDLLSRTSSQSQDLRLSLQSFHDPILLHQHQHQHQHQHTQTHHQNEQMLFPGFDGSSAGWSEQHHPAEIGRFQRMLAWNAGTETGSGNSGGNGEFLFNSSPTHSTQPLLQPFFGQNQFFPQRGPLQSSNTPSVRAWIDPSFATATTAHHHLIPPTFHQSSISTTGFASGGFSGFRVPARIQGEEEHDGISHKPSSASSDSRH